MVAGGTFIEMALSQFVINLRYALMALSLSQKVDKSLNTPWRFITGVGITISFLSSDNTVHCSFIFFIRTPACARRIIG